jgi:choice-of-anchor B domain-containing protein
MKIKFTFFAFLLCAFISAQTYPSLNMTLLSKMDPNGDNTGNDGRKYSGCWGWVQTSKNKEYALVGASSKTYFIDITNPLLPVICDSVDNARTGCTWRELKTYQNYCYIVSDDAAPNTFQIIDMQYLPDSVHVVHDGTTYFERGHTVWVDGDKLYVGGVTSTTPTLYNMQVYSLATPSVPLLLRTLSDDYPSINYVHDMFVRNDTVYASAGNQGLYVYKFNTATNTFTQLGSFTGYPEAGYNHASSLTKNGKTLVFCDEVPTGVSIKLADVSNLSNIVMSSTVEPNSNTEMVAHNPYVIGNELAFVSCYQDGLIVYDITNPNAPYITGYFDTHPQGGANAGNNYGSTSYRGNWGAYPYLPSKVVIALDMQNGIFFLKSDALGVKENINVLNANIYPNPAKNNLNIMFTDPSAKNYAIEITNVLGQIVYNEKNLNDCSFPVTFKTINLSGLESGSYLVSIKADEKQYQKKIIIAK